MQLPVYYHWEFSTGPAGDFESLARRLRTPSAYKNTPVGDALAHVGTAPMGVDDLLNGVTPGLEATMEGALRSAQLHAGHARPSRSQADSLAIIVNTPPTRSSTRSATAARTPPARASRSSRRCTATGT